MQHTPYEPMTTRMSTKGQVVIPRAAREMLGVGDGTQFSIRIEGNGYKLVPKRRSMEEFLAFAQKMREKYAIKADTHKDIDALIMASVAQLDERTHAKPKKRRRKL